MCGRLAHNRKGNTTSQMTSPSPTDERQQDSIPVTMSATGRSRTCRGIAALCGLRKMFLEEKGGYGGRERPFLRSGPLLGAGRGGPDKVVHVVAVRLDGIVFNGHRHGMQLVASINLPLFNPLEPVGIIALRIIFAVMPGA